MKRLVTLIAILSCLAACDSKKTESADRQVTTTDDGRTAKQAEEPELEAPEKKTPGKVVEIGDPMPDYQVQSLDGDPRTLEKGAPTLVNFWATWCVPCRAEMPLLAEIDEGNEALDVVAVSVDAKGQKKKLDEYVAELDPPFTIWWDPDNAASTVFGVSSLPVNVLYDAEGKVAFFRTGPIEEDDEEFQAALEKATGG